MKTILLNPFERYKERELLLVGIFSILVGSFLGFILEARFDGVFDLHFGSEVDWLQPLLDNLINIFSSFVFLFLLGKYLNNKTRAIDILSVCIVARIPFYLGTLLNINNIVSNASNELLKNPMPTSLEGISIPSLIIVLFVALVGILLLVWFVTLLYKGFQVASNTKGTKTIVLFIIAVLLAETLSKVLIYYFN